MNISLLFFILGFAASLAIVLTGFGIWFFMNRRWNIPVTIFRHTGDQTHPSVILTKGKKEVIDNCVQLRIKGYRRRFRDFQSGNYYPSPGTPFGAIVCFEFEDGWITPLAPILQRSSGKRLAELKKLLKRLDGVTTKEQKTEIHEILSRIRELSANVRFNYVKHIHEELTLNIVDDVDSESYLMDQARIRSQYQGLAGWFKEHQVAILLMLALVCMTVVAIMWIRQPPANAAQMCIQQIRGICSDAWNVTITQNQGYGQQLLRNVANASGLLPPG